MAAEVKPSSRRTAKSELKDILKDPVEGFEFLGLVEENFNKWSMAMFGPPYTVYQGGYFKMELSFPEDYPFHPPTLQFMEREPFWHPNVHTSGYVCMSILDSEDQLLPGQDTKDLWNSAMSARSVLISLLSILAEPNTLSAANVDASGQYSRWKKSGDKAFPEHVQRDVARSAEAAKREGVKIPVTMEDYVSEKPLTLQIQCGHTSDSDTDPLEAVTPPSSP